MGTGGCSVVCSPLSSLPFPPMASEFPLFPHLFREMQDEIIMRMTPAARALFGFTSHDAHARYVAAGPMPSQRILQLAARDAQRICALQALEASLDCVYVGSLWDLIDPLHPCAATRDAFFRALWEARPPQFPDEDTRAFARLVPYLRRAGGLAEVLAATIRPYSDGVYTFECLAVEAARHGNTQLLDLAMQAYTQPKGGFRCSAALVGVRLASLQSGCPATVHRVAQLFGRALCQWDIPTT
jgi:hypothetical protein